MRGTYEVKSWMNFCYASRARFNGSVTFWCVSVFRASGKQHMPLFSLINRHRWKPHSLRDVYGFSVLGLRHFLCFVTWHVLWSTYRRWFETVVTSMTTSESANFTARWYVGFVSESSRMSWWDLTPGLKGDGKLLYFILRRNA